MFCMQCGNKLDNGDKFCRICGTPRADETDYQVPDASQVQVRQSDARDFVCEDETAANRKVAQPSEPAAARLVEPRGERAATRQEAQPAERATTRQEAQPAPERDAQSSTHPGANGAVPCAKLSRKKAYIAVAAVIAVLIAVAVGAVAMGGEVDSSISNAQGAPSVTDVESGSASADQVDDAASNSAASDADVASGDTSVFQEGDTASNDAVQPDNPAPGSSPSEPAEEEPPADRIQANGFSFELPEYWKGRVLCSDTGDGVAIYPDTQLGAVEGYELATLSLVSADEPENAGDYISHIAGRVRGDGVRVDVASKNWAAFYGGDWYRHPNYAGSSQEQEMAAALIDLSSGGLYNYDDVRAVAESATSDADATSPFNAIDVDFLAETLIPTVQIDDADACVGDGYSGNADAVDDDPAEADAENPDADGMNPGVSIQSEEDYEFIAKTMAMQMFTTAEETADGGMRWIGIGYGLELVKPGSAAAANDYWNDVRSHEYRNIATDATATTIDARHYQVQVTYETAMDTAGTNRRANIASVELWVDEHGWVEDIEVISLG